MVDIHWRFRCEHIFTVIQSWLDQIELLGGGFTDLVVACWDILFAEDSIEERRLGSLWEFRCNWGRVKVGALEQSRSQRSVGLGLWEGTGSGFIVLKHLGLKLEGGGLLVCVSKHNGLFDN